MSMLPIPLEGRTEWVHVLSGSRAGRCRVILGADDEFEVSPADETALVEAIGRALSARQGNGAQGGTRTHTPCGTGT